MADKPVILITGTRKGIGRYLVQYYAQNGYSVLGCSRSPCDYNGNGYRHFVLDILDESKVKQMFTEIRNTYRRLDVLINNAGIASMNHTLLTPLDTAQKIINTNFVGTFLLCREAAKVMQRNRYGRIVNFTTAATPLKLEGEAIYASSKAAIITFTQILGKELADFGITVNAIGPTLIKTDLIKSVPGEKIQSLIDRQAIRRFGEFRDVSNVIDFFIRPESDFVTGQVVFLGGL